MTLDVADAIRDPMLDLFESTPGTAALLKIRTGTPPGVGSADTGTLLVTITLPTDWMNAASGGSKTKLGTWSASASGTGTAGYFSLWNSGDTTKYYEGTVTGTGGGGDIELDNTSINTGQTVTMDTFTLNAGN